MNHVSGVPLKSFEEPIRAALSRYSDNTDGRVVFDTDSAPRLELTPDKPNSARSATVVKHLGETAGTLYVIVFAHEDGTGDESAYKLTDSMSDGSYPREPKVVPRSKAAFHNEGHLTIASHFPHEPNLDPVMFAGHLDLIGFKEARFAQLAHLGQGLYDFTEATNRERPAKPTVTFTTGYSEATGERFGDPHSVFNYQQHIQVCGFIAVTNELADQHGAMLKTLGAVEPVLQF